MAKAQGDQFKVEQLARISLTFKTFKALKELVKREAARKME